MIGVESRVRFLERDENPCPPDGLLDGMEGTVVAEIGIDADKSGLFNVAAALTFLFFALHALAGMPLELLTH